MKSLVESIQQSILESKGTVYVFFNHENPDDTYIYAGSDADLIAKVEDSFEVMPISLGSNQVLYIRHSDEWGHCAPYRNFAAFKKECMDAFKNAEKGEGWIYLDLPTGGFEYEDESADKINKMSDAQLYKKFVEDYIEDSYIDRDSASATYIVDMKKQEVILGGEGRVVFMTDKDLREWYEY